ncbi:MAG: DUF6111 family protein [Pseudomonadota bacterium]
MIRIVIENIVLFALPTLLYIAFVMIRRRGQANNTATQALDDAPLFWLLAIGAALAISVLAIFGSTEFAEPGKTYQPPVFRDGKIVPGRHE